MKRRTHSECIWRKVQGRRTIDRMGEEVRGGWREFTVRGFIISVPRQILLGNQIKKNLIGREYERHGRREMHTQF
jgi:hypothetical protein